MANFELPITFEMNLRNCMVDGRPGYFHCWEQYSQPIAPSLLVGGHPGGTVAQVYGIVEFTYGIRRIQPYNIEFVDDLHDSLDAWEECLDERDKDGSSDNDIQGQTSLFNGD